MIVCPMTILYSVTLLLVVIPSCTSLYFRGESCLDQYIYALVLLQPNKKRPIYREKTICHRRSRLLRFGFLICDWGWSFGLYATEQIVLSWLGLDGYFANLAGRRKKISSDVTIIIEL